MATLDQESLTRLFANALSPIDTLGRGQVIIAENRLRRQEVLADAARRLFERTEELKAQQKFSKEQAEAAREAQSTERALDRAQQSRLAAESREAQIDYLERQRELIEKARKEDREEAQRVAKANRERVTRTYQALKKERDGLAKEVEALKTIPLSVNNQWVREIAQKHGASESLLKAAFDPKSTTDISANLTKLGGDKAALAIADLENRQTAYLDRNAEDLRFKQAELIGLNQELRTLVKDVDLGDEVSSGGAATDGLGYFQPVGAPGPLDLRSVVDTIVRETQPQVSQSPSPFTQAAIDTARSVAAVPPKTLATATRILSPVVNPLAAIQRYGPKLFQRGPEVRPLTPGGLSAVQTAPTFQPQGRDAVVPEIAPEVKLQVRETIKAYARRKGMSDVEFDELANRAESGDEYAKQLVIGLANEMKAERALSQPAAINQSDAADLRLPIVPGTSAAPTRRTPLPDPAPILVSPLF